MKYFDTFTGIGGFTKAIQDLIPQAECVGFSEIDKYATQIYKKHYPDHKNYGDITQINTAELPDFDLLVGGFPCQAFSVAGKRQGFEDTRGTLFFELARILKDKRPRHFIFENVRGLLSHDSGKTFQTILKVLSKIGYDVQWQVLNSKNFGVPQNRERIFIVGHIRGECRPEVFPIRETTRATQKRYRENAPKVEIAQTIRSRYGNGSGSHILQLNKPKHSNDRVYDPKGISPTLNTMQGGNRQPFIQQGKIRRLTPTECERLHEFHDGWTEGVSDTQRYKCLGNAVTVNVVREVVASLYEL